MPLRLLKLFQSSPTGHNDGLTQTEREAIADLLHYCMYADSHLADAEVRVVDEVVAFFDWDPKVAFETYEARSITNARRAKEDALYRAEFVASINARLKSAKARELARKVSRNLFAADGKHVDAEKTLAAALETILK